VGSLPRAYVRVTAEGQVDASGPAEIANPQPRKFGSRDADFVVSGRAALNEGSSVRQAIEIREVTSK
jgi:hypothetical protein